MLHVITFSRVGVISGASLYIRDEFEQVDKKPWLQVIFFFFCTIVLIFRFLLDLVGSEILRSRNQAKVNG